MVRAKTSEIPRLVRRLGSRRRSCADGARARLSVIGARAVDDLVEALEGADNRIRARVMPLLALIQDPRCRAPLTAMLLDRSARLRALAAQSLARFASADTVAALKRVLERERSATVREAAARALVEQFAAGQEQALACVLTLLRNTDEAPRTRLAAFAIAPQLPPAERRALLARLRRDPVAEVRRRSEALTALGCDAADPRPAEVVRAIADLACEDYAVWNQAVQRLGACGAPAIVPLIDAMRERAGDPEFCTRTGMALKAMGPRRARALAEVMESIDEPLPLQILVEVIGALGEKSLIYRLKELTDRVAVWTRAAEPAAIEAIQRVRAKAHLELAKVGSRVAIQDLREALAGADRRIETEMLTAVRLIGKRDEIAVLLRAYVGQHDLTKREIAEVVRTILRRERIRRNNRMFRALSAEQCAALEEILPPRGRRPPARSRPAEREPG